MINNYILIDFENIQPDNLSILKGHNFKLIIFVGSNQKKISFDLAQDIQSFGNNAEYIRIEGSGQNALDFHIAFYIGKLSASDKNAYFHIISKDTGFDPLINHLITNKIKVKRQKNVEEIPILQNLNSESTDKKVITKEAHNLSKINSENVRIALNSLIIKQGKPTTNKALSNLLNDLFKKKLNEKDVSSLIKEITDKKFISISNNKVSYFLPNKIIE